MLAAAASGIRDQVGRNGGDPEEVLYLSGISDGSLADKRSPLDLGAYVQMMEIAARNTGNDNFGLHYGAQFKPEMLGLIGEIVLASRDMGAALSSLVDYFPFHQQATEVCLVREGRLIHIEYRILDGGIVDRRQDAELTLGMFTNMCRAGLGCDWAPQYVYCEHPRPSEPEEHERAFSAPVHFGQRTNALILWEDDLLTPMPGADVMRLARLKQELTAVSDGRGQVALADRVKSEIRSRLAEGSASIECVCDALRIPRWGLQRRLALSGYNFSDLLDFVRRDLAARYLRQQSITITDAAFLLGYSELSAFSRACRRWFGQSPQSFRYNAIAKAREAGKRLWEYPN